MAWLTSITRDLIIIIGGTDASMFTKYFLRWRSRTCQTKLRISFASITADITVRTYLSLSIIVLALARTFKNIIILSSRHVFDSKPSQAIAACTIKLRRPNTLETRIMAGLARFSCRIIIESWIARTCLRCRDISSRGVTCLAIIVFEAIASKARIVADGTCVSWCLRCNSSARNNKRRLFASRGDCIPCVPWSTVARA